ncbi:hypothetical protein [Sediminimonas sp.]|uniref:hypothetical protein n=1 Tax=Sediminimonas sp. TaxID=2823379 RepID=UPI0025DA4D5E|nr:hypothetical protein [Sediminimonas sp.]
MRTTLLAIVSSVQIIGLPSETNADTLISDFVDVCAHHFQSNEAAKQEARSLGYSENDFVDPSVTMGVKQELEALTGDSVVFWNVTESPERIAFFSIGSASKVFPDTKRVCAFVVLGGNAKIAQGDLVTQMFLSSPDRASTTPDQTTMLWELDGNATKRVVRFNTSNQSEVDGYALALFVF